MKPKNLKPPFSRDERRVVLEDRVLYVPERLEEYPPLFSSWAQAFGNQRPVKVEICSGNGDWVVSQALREPGTNWVAIEKRFDRVRKIWAKRENHQLHNLFIVCGEALLSLSKYFVSGSVEAVYINFPDPWPKIRHAKHRLIQRPFLDQMTQTLVAGGELVFVTDELPYCDQGVALLGRHGAFTCVGDTPYRTEWAGYGDSWFERLWRKRGKKIYYLHYQFTGDRVVKEAPMIG